MKQGIHSILDIRDRCQIDDKCWIWSMARTNGSSGVRTPVCYLPELGRVVTVRRAILVLQKVDLTPDIVGWNTCRNTSCCAPHHTAHGTKGDFGRFIAQRGNRKGMVSLRLGSRKPRKNHTPLEVREAVLSSKESGKVLALQLGISESAVSRLRLGKSYAGVSGSTVFSRLAA